MALRLLPTLALALAAAGPAFAAPLPHGGPPAGLNCPDEIADADRVAMASAGLEAGVTGYCSYGLAPGDGEDDVDSDDATVTMTLKIAATPDYDWQKSFKARNVEEGEMTVASETQETSPFGDGERTATVVSLAKDETDLGDVTKSFRTLWVFDLGGGKVMSLEEEYTNLGENRRQALRDALLKAQKP